MGLDMYLKKRTFIGANYEHRNATGQINIKVGDKVIDVDFNRVTYIEEEVMYWRKANQIHQFFVNKVQDGIDDCKSYPVSVEILEELLELCKEVKKKAILIEGKISNGYTVKDSKREVILEDGKYIINEEEIAKIFPTQPGFFFGSTDYDQYYMEDIDYTIKELSKILSENNKGAYFEYRSSW